MSRVLEMTMGPMAFTGLDRRAMPFRFVPG